MEDIDKAISTLQELIRCNDVEEVRKLKRKFEDLVKPTEKTTRDYESMPLIDELNEQTKAFVLKVEKLSGRGMFPEGIALDVFEENRGDILPTSKLAGETTAIRNMEKIYNSIIGDVKKIGVCGMGGIGKTTVMKHINNRIITEQKDKFDCVIWVTVSKESSVFKLQNDIACNLEVDLSNYKDTIRRAGALFKAFQEKGRYLLILDDLWEGFLLEDVGISDPDDSDYANGCKLALTTRSFDVCRSMKCEVIQMDLLSQEEAWSLFLQHVGRYVLEITDLVPIVCDVASECACLPLAIVTIARSMAGKKEVCDWRDALLELRAFLKEPGDKGKKVIEQLKFSYDRLENKRLQKCLLFLAFYPEDFYIMRREFVELLALEGIIDEKESTRDEIDKGNAMLNHLINQCLLEGEITSKEDSWVKMHDLVRDMALQIDGLHCQYSAVSCIESSDVKWSKDYLKIHISMCYSLNASPMCPRITTFILRYGFFTNIPDSFFQHFKALKVLKLFYCFSLEVLPNSISDLVNLVGLLLIDCPNLRYVSSLARLKDLQTLNFSLENKKNPYLWVKRDFLIESLEELSNLRYVNLIIFPIEVFPSGIIRKLSNLRCLVCSPFTKVWANELMGLKKLEMFKGAFHDIHDLRVYVKYIKEKRSRLTSYFFIVGPTFGSSMYWHYYENNSTEKSILLINCNLGKLAVENIEYLLPKDVQRLEIDSVPDLTSLCTLTSLNDMRICKIGNCDGVRELVFNSSSSSFVQQSLESLELLNMKNLESLIGRKEKACNVFPCLRVLVISGCDRMKVVFNIGLLSNLNNLEDLTIKNCQKLEEIIGEWSDDVKDIKEAMTEITLPKLKHLHFGSLPHLRSICPTSRLLICKSLQKIDIRQCPELGQCVYVALDESSQPSLSDTLRRIELK